MDHTIAGMNVLGNQLGKIMAVIVATFLEEVMTGTYSSRIVTVSHENQLLAMEII